MKIATIGVEDWLNVYEKSATVDIAQSTIASLTMDEILRLDGTLWRQCRSRSCQHHLP